MLFATMDNPKNATWYLCPHSDLKDISHKNNPLGTVINTSK